MNVVFIIYKRPKLTAQVFRKISQVKPERLFIIADGPRSEEERQLCESARAVIQVDWPCEVKSNIAETNMGCRRRVASGLAWVFSQIEEAIILEDDCLPDSSFFPFCSQMLDLYRNDSRVGHIAGCNLLKGYKRGAQSYYYSKYAPIWGWATWRRAWLLYDVDMKTWPVMKAHNWHYDMFDTHQEADFFAKEWDEVLSERLDTWDVQWLYSSLCQGSVSVVSSVNLVSNIGFDPAAHRTKDPNDPMANLITEPMQFPLKHPPHRVCDRQADQNFASSFRLSTASQPSLLLRIKMRLLNKYWYGALFRRVPLLGAIWAQARSNCLWNKKGR